MSLLGQRPTLLNPAARSSDLAAKAVLTPTDAGYDIWILCGQSNMVGAGSATGYTQLTDPPHPRVYTFPSAGANANVITQAVEPQAFRLGNGNLDPGFTFARWAVDSVVPANRRMLLCPCAESTTGFVSSYDNLHTWAVSNVTANSLYLFAVGQAQAALTAANLQGGANRIAGVLWLQGEQDSLNGSEAAAYAVNLDALIAGFRGLFGSTLPFIICSMSPEFVTNTGANAATVNAAHIDTPRRNVLTGFGYGRSGQTNVDLTHYGAAGQRANGQAFLGAYVRALANVLGTPPPAVTGLALTQSGTSILVKWAQSARVTDYTVQYRVTGAGSWTTLSRSSPNIDVNATITGLTNGTSYDVQVSSTNEQGTSAYTGATLLTVVVPGQVTGLTTGTATGSVMPLTWTVTPTATSYLVEYKLHSAGSYTTFATVTTAATSVFGLLSGTSYDFRVTASNAAGAGTPSAVSTASTATINALITDVGVSAARAYGMRKLVAAYAGSAIRVRRSSDNTTQDIGFVNGNLDTASMLTFCGAGNGFVNILYDQSGNARDLTQATQAAQPQIVAAGVVNTLNGEPGMIFNGTSHTLSDASAGAYAAGSASVLMVIKALNATLSYVIGEWRNVTSNSFYLPLGNNNAQAFMQIETDAATFPLNSTATNRFDGALNQFSFVDTGTVAEQWLNGAAASTGAVAYTRATTTLTNFALGSRINIGGAAGNFSNFFLSEAIIFYSNLTTGQRQAGEANQKSFYATP